ncbi:hypothetical protein ID875_28405 [Streptomyces globisporus]|uniref:Uncharacterized protein n=1 Tax=Streptomyces globisporus TaxID=1908 RepID=A0A927BMI6_STRGL|nr:hypothetical protein [Streptomyces globisporus]
MTTYPLADLDRAVRDQRAGLTTKPVLLPAPDRAPTALPHLFPPAQEY